MIPPALSPSGNKLECAAAFCAVGSIQICYGTRGSCKVAVAPCPPLLAAHYSKQLDSMCPQTSPPHSTGCSPIHQHRALHRGLWQDTASPLSPTSSWLRACFAFLHSIAAFRITSTVQAGNMPRDEYDKRNSLQWMLQKASMETGMMWFPKEKHISKYTF